MKYINAIMGAIYISGVLCLSYLDNHPDEYPTLNSENIEVQENVQEIGKKEEKPAKEEEKSVEKPAISIEKKVEEKKTATEKTPVPPAPAPAPAISKMETATYTYEDYEKTILGTCPSQRDKSSSWERGNRLNAIGIITSGESKTSPMNSLNALIESWWNDYKLGGWTGRHMMASLNNVAGFDKTWSNSRIAFFIDFDGLFVNWDNSWEDNKTINATDEQMKYLDHLVSDGTNYLRWLDSTYNAKCPND